MALQEVLGSDLYLWFVRDMLPKHKWWLQEHGSKENLSKIGSLAIQLAVKRIKDPQHADFRKDARQVIARAAQLISDPAERWRQLEKAVSKLDMVTNAGTHAS